jgi:hypothetical protein
MKKNLAFILILSMLLLSACSSDSYKSEEPPTDDTVQKVQDISEEPESVEQNEEESSIESGWHTLPSGVKVLFFDTVRNDVTGNWRLSETSDSIPPSDYAIEYYQEMFSSDDEIHAIWNSVLETTTKISVSGNLLFIDTHEYVKGEEHDANLMFSGTVLDSEIIDLETGEPFE